MTTYYLAPSPTGSDSNAGTAVSPWLTVAKFLTSSSAGDTLILLDGTYAMVNATITNRTIRAQNVFGAVLDAGSAAKIWTCTGTTVIDGVKVIDDVQGYFAGASGTTFRRCWFHDCLIQGLGYGVVVPGGGYVTGCVFENCGNNSDSIAVNIAGAAYIYNCVCYSDRATNIMTSFARSSGGNVVMKNNIIVNAGPSAFQYANLYNLSAVIRNNCFYGNLTYLDQGAVTLDAANNITSDPLLIDAANSDFRLRPTSPCIATGVAI